MSETVVYVVTFGGVVSALNAATGGLVWQRSLGSEVDSSPAVYRGTVYVGDLNGTLHALNAATGAVRCSFTLPVIAPATAPGQIVSSPVVGSVDATGPTVFIGDAGLHPPGTPDDVENGGHFWAITGVGNTARGCREKWVYDNWHYKGATGLQTGVWDEPALVRNSRGGFEVVFGTSNPDDSVYALDAVTGSRLWRFHTQRNGPDEDVGAGPTIGLPGANGFADGVVYIDGKDGIEYALDLLTGKMIWSFTLGPGGHHGQAVSEAALSGDTLVVGYENSLFALNATTGAVIWNLTAGATVQASSAISGPSGDQVVFVGDNTGTEYGLNLQTGSQVFAAVNSGNLTASAAVADGTLYFISNGTLYAYGQTVKVFAGYVYTSRTGLSHPSPWRDSPNVVFEGCNYFTPSRCPTIFRRYDSGALRLDNPTAQAMTVTNASVTIGSPTGSCTFKPWPHLHVTVPAGKSLILTQTGGKPPCGARGEHNFDTSETNTSSTKCTEDDGKIPVFHVTVDGQALTYRDTGQILNTGGKDPGGVHCGSQDETHAWAPTSGP